MSYHIFQFTWALREPLQSGEELRKRANAAQRRGTSNVSMFDEV